MKRPPVGVEDFHSTARVVPATWRPENVRDRIEAALLALLTGTIRWTPKFIFPLIARAAVLARFLAAKDLRRLRSNLELIFGWAPGSAESRAFEKRCIEHQVTSMLESIRMILDPGSGHVAGFSPFAEQVQQSLGAGRGAVFAAAHFGSWELCSYSIAKATSPGSLTVLAKPPRSRALRSLIERLRGAGGASVLWTDRKTILRDMLGIMKSGGALGIVMDQKPEGRRGPLVQFFGVPTEFVGGPAALAVKTGCAVIGIHALREGPFRYRIVSEELVPPNHGLSDQVAMTQRLASSIEAVIRERPEQWAWTYKRWRDSDVPVR